MQKSMHTKAHHLAEYALSPGTPALQTSPYRQTRKFAVCALSLLCFAVSLGYLLGRIRNAAPRFDAMSAQH